MYSAGDCIIIPTNHYKDRRPKAHLFIVIIDVIKNTDRTILLPLCTINPNHYYDKTVIINPGEHDFIKDPSFVDYQYGRVESVATLESMIKQGKARVRKPPFNKSVYQRIADGISKSVDTPFIVSSIYEDYLLRRR